MGMSNIYLLKEVVYFSCCGRKVPDTCCKPQEVACRGIGKDYIRAHSPVAPAALDKPSRHQRLVPARPLLCVQIIRLVGMPQLSSPSESAHR